MYTKWLKRTMIFRAKKAWGIGQTLHYGNIKDCLKISLFIATTTKKSTSLLGGYRDMIKIWKKSVI